MPQSHPPHLKWISSWVIYVTQLPTVVPSQWISSNSPPGESWHVTYLKKMWIGNILTFSHSTNKAGGAESNLSKTTGELTIRDN
jgi:hypothetical protein